MTIAFIIPYVPIPRMVKRINIAKEVDNVSLIYWDRGTESSENEFIDGDIYSKKISLFANEGSPFKRLIPTIKFVIEIFKFLNLVNPDIIHVTKTDMLLAVRIYLLFVSEKPKIIYEVSDIHKYALSSKTEGLSVILKKILYLTEKVCFKIVDKLIVTSPYFWERYYSKMISKNNVTYLANTPNESIFEFYEATDNKKFTVSFIGKVRYVEQLKNLIDISGMANINVLIAGNGIGYEEIKLYSKGKNNIKVIGSYNYKNDIAELYSMSDAIFSAYDTSIENVRIALPNRLYESAYCGLPLIVSKDTYLEEIVIKNGLGVSINPKNKHDLLDKILTLKDPKNLEEYRINGWNFYKKNNEKVVSNKNRELYCNLLM